MTLTATQAATAKAIINLFETGTVRGDYAAVTVLAGDTGHLSYGRSQVTLGSGSLSDLLTLYVNRHGARLADDLQPYLERVAARDFSLDDDGYFKNLLRCAADDDVMRDCQDEYFDDEFWASALRLSRNAGIESPLGVCIVYDSRVHGSWANLKRRTNARLAGQAFDERTWLSAYVAERRAWLASHSRQILRQTTYRMDTFSALMAQDGWNLELPLVVRGAEINLHTLNALPRTAFDGPALRSRDLALVTPLMRGADVRRVQTALSRSVEGVVADGIFGRASRAAVTALQARLALPATGRVGVAEFEAFDL